MAANMGTMEPPAVRLRPFEERDLWFFDRFAKEEQFSAPFEWAGFSSAEAWRRRWHDDGLLGASPYSLAVDTVDDDALVGWVDWRENARLGGTSAWEIGVLVLPEERGRGIGTEAQRELVSYLFATTPCHRVWAGTEVENVAEQRALERAGLRREGCLRGHRAITSAQVGGGTRTSTASLATTGPAEVVHRHHDLVCHRSRIGQALDGALQQVRKWASAPATGIRVPRPRSRARGVRNRRVRGARRGLSVFLERRHQSVCIVKSATRPASWIHSARVGR
ncbi:MAG: GNAT family N-acetyltransferase [Ilumatobacteraceae bacterium]